jgi:hypothetical protein
LFCRCTWNTPARKPSAASSEMLSQDVWLAALLPLARFSPLPLALGGVAAAAVSEEEAAGSCSQKLDLAFL